MKYEVHSITDVVSVANDQNIVVHTDQDRAAEGRIQTPTQLIAL